MGLFSRKRRSEEPPGDPNDPLAALQRAQEALSKTHLVDDGHGHHSRLNHEMVDEMSAALERAQSGLESGRGSTFGSSVQGGAGSPFAQPPAAEDPITKVERLVKLRDEGALTQEEFDEQKRKALGES